MLLAIEEDSRSLAGSSPTLVTPGDLHGGRYVAGVRSITLSQLPTPPAAAGPAGSLTLAGAVKAPKTLSFADLQALPQQNRTVTFQGTSGPETHSERGPLLTAVLSVAELDPPAGVKNGNLRLVVAASAADDQTGVGVGETDASFGNVPALVSLEEDGNSLSAVGPRLIVPGDVKDGRQVKAVHTLTVVNPDPATYIPPGISDRGVRLVTGAGTITSVGGAASRGDLTGKTLSAQIVAADTAEVPDVYWLAGADGGVFNFGGAPFLGSMGAAKLNQPIVDIAATPSAKGYWLAAADGGVFAYGDGGFLGSTGSLKLNQPIVDMIATMPPSWAGIRRPRRTPSSSSSRPPVPATGSSTPTPPSPRSAPCRPCRRRRPTAPW